MSKNEKILRIGLGEAISRLMNLELMRSNRLHPMPDQAIAEREMLYLALNEIKIDLGFDCDGDGLPDTVEIFEESAKSSCCRLVQSDDSLLPTRKKINRSKIQKGKVTRSSKPKEEIKKERKSRSSSRKK